MLLATKSSFLGSAINMCGMFEIRCLNVMEVRLT